MIKKQFLITISSFICMFVSAANLIPVCKFRSDTCEYIPLTHLKAWNQTQMQYVDQNIEVQPTNLSACFTDLVIPNTVTGNIFVNALRESNIFVGALLENSIRSNQYLSIAELNSLLQKLIQPKTEFYLRFNNFSPSLHHIRAQTICKLFRDDTGAYRWISDAVDASTLPGNHVQQTSLEALISEGLLPAVNVAIVLYIEQENSR